MTRSIPWGTSPHLNPTGERPIFIAELGLDHQSFELGLYDHLPGSVQGRVTAFDPIRFQNRGGQDSIQLGLVNAPSSALGKAYRCAAVSDSTTEGGYLEAVASSGDPFALAGGAGRSFAMICRAWGLDRIPASGSYLVFREGQIRLILHRQTNVGQGADVELQYHDGSSWVTLYTDAGAYVEGELAAFGFVWTGTNLRYHRVTDSGGAFQTAAAATINNPASSVPFIINGDGVGFTAGSQGYFVPHLDVDEVKWWTTNISGARWRVKARRTLKPAEVIEVAEAGDSLIWLRCDDDSSTPAVVNNASGFTVGVTKRASTGATEPATISGITRDRITDHITPDYPIAGATVTIKLTFTDPQTNAPIPLFVGRARKLVSITDTEVVLDVVDLSSLVDVQLGEVIDEKAYPSAPTDSVGKIKPIVFGALPNFPGIRVVAAKRARLAASALAGDTTFDVESTTGWPSSGSFRINEEEISYTGTTATSFTGLTRGINSTTANSHVAGNQIVEIVTENYLLCGHAATISSVGLVNSRGEIIPADPSTYSTYSGATAAGVTFTRPPRVRVRGEGSLFTSIDMEDKSPFDNSLDAEQACGLNALFEETNWATINQSAPKLSIERTSPFASPAQSAGILRAWIVIEHHNVSALSAGATVEARVESGGVTVTTLGNLAAVATTPDVARERGNASAPAKGFEGGHSHMIPGSAHDHNVGQEVLSTVIRARGGRLGWARGRGSAWNTHLTLPPPAPPGTQFPTNANSPISGFTDMHDSSPVQLASDGDNDTFEAASGNLLKLAFGGITNSNRQILRAALVIVASGPVQTAGGSFDFVVQGVPRLSIPNGATNDTGGGFAGREIFRTPSIILAGANLLLADLLRPDSFILCRAPSGTYDVFEAYIEVELDNTAMRSTTIRPSLDDWPKPLRNMRDGRFGTSEPNHYTFTPTHGRNPFPGIVTPTFVQHWLNPELLGPMPPMNTQTQPSVKFRFTDIAEPRASIDRISFTIAHSNSFSDGIRSFTPGGAPGVGSNPTQWDQNYFPPGFPTGIAATLPATWAATANIANLRPRYFARLVIKGTVVASFFLDGQDLAVPVVYTPETTPTSVQALNPIFDDVLFANLFFSLPIPIMIPGLQSLRMELDGRFLGPGQSRVETCSGWIDVSSLNLRVSDIVDQTTFLEIVMPQPTLQDAVTQVSVGPAGGSPAYADQASIYAGDPGLFHMRFYDVRVEFESSEVEENALLRDTGPTATAGALSFSSPNWFDWTATFILRGGFGFTPGDEIVCEAMGFNATDFTRILRAWIEVEFGTVEEEDTTLVVADVDSGDGGNPIDHVARIFTDYLPGDYRDTTAFTAAAALARTDAAGAVRAPESALERVAAILRQYEFSGHWESGLFVPLHKPALSLIGSAVHTFTVDEVVRGSVLVEETDAEDVVNLAGVLWGPQYLEAVRAGQGARGTPIDLVRMRSHGMPVSSRTPEESGPDGWTGLQDAESASSQAAYGVRRVIEPADWCQSSAAAAAFADSLIDYGNHVATIVTFAAYLDALPYVRGDIVGLTHHRHTSAKLEIVEMLIIPPRSGEAPRILFVTIDRERVPS